MAPKIQRLDSEAELDYQADFVIIANHPVAEFVSGFFHALLLLLYIAGFSWLGNSLHGSFQQLQFSFQHELTRPK